MDAGELGGNRSSWYDVLLLKRRGRRKGSSAGELAS